MATPADTALMMQLGAECIELRKKEDLEQPFDGLVLPGGESTVQGKLLRELEMYDFLKEKIESGMPVLATCAGLILLAEHLSNDEQVQVLAHVDDRIVAVQYGAQIGLSFHPELDADNRIHEKFLELIAD